MNLDDLDLEEFWDWFLATHKGAYFSLFEFAGYCHAKGVPFYNGILKAYRALGLVEQIDVPVERKKWVINERR